METSSLAENVSYLKTLHEQLKHIPGDAVEVVQLFERCRHAGLLDGEEDNTLSLAAGTVAESVAGADILRTNLVEAKYLLSLLLSRSDR